MDEVAEVVSLTEQKEKGYKEGNDASCSKGLLFINTQLWYRNILL